MENLKIGNSKQVVGFRTKMHLTSLYHDRKIKMMIL